MDDDDLALGTMTPKKRQSLEKIGERKGANREMPNTVGLGRNPPYLRYLWVVMSTARGGEFIPWKGFSWASLKRALDKITIKQYSLYSGWVIDLDKEVLVPIRPEFKAWYVFMVAWRKNYYDPNWVFRGVTTDYHPIEAEVPTTMSPEIRSKVESPSPVQS